jgi:integrase
VRESTEQTSQHKARLVEIKRRGALADQGTGIAKRPVVRLKAFIEDYLTWARTDHPATADEKDARILPTFLEVVGDKRLDHLGPFDIERWRTARAKTVIRARRTLSRSSVNRELTIVRGLFAKAVEWNRLATSPVVAIEDWATDEPAIRVLTAEERVIVLTQLPRRYAMYCRVTLEALLRIQEVLHLRRTDLGEASIQRRLKGGKVGRVPVSRALIADLRAFLETDDQEYVFGDPPPKPRSTASLMTRAFRAAGLHGISHHVMRHTGVTDMLEDGVSPKAIQQYAGWTSLRMLERYGHLRDAELQRATTGTAARNTAALAEAERQNAAQQDAPAQTGPAQRVGTKPATR